ncbi:MAG: hypothetical protein V1722_03380 [Candidatus Micrarchaeota archaeon]
MSMRLLKPRIVNIVDKLTGRRPKNLMDYSSKYGIEKGASAFGGAITKVFSDHEVKLLLLWSVISPSAGLAYLVWVKYPEYKIISVPLFLISIVQFVGQWGGLYLALQRMGIVS